jgi:glycosyltransferase involved in cell wall biosynthesis
VIRVLYVDHTASISGAERSLLTVLSALPDEVDPTLASPSGPLAERAAALGVPTREIAGTEASLRVTSPATAGAVVDMGRSALQLARIARSSGADVLHANSIRAAMLAVVAGRIARRPVVAHIRDTLPPGPVSGASLRLIARGARTVIGNSSFTSAAFTAATGRADVVTLFNPVDVDGIASQRTQRSAARAALGLEEDALALGVVGQITPWKGQEEALRAATLLARRGRPVQLLIVGEAKFLESTTRYDNRTYLDGLRRLAADPAVDGRVHFLGEREDVPAVLSALDVLLVPSWQEPFGRVVVEGMAAAVPVIATGDGGPAEIIDEGVSGLLVPSRSPEALAAAVERLVDEPGLAGRLATAGSEAARRFLPAEHVAALVGVYRAALTR